MALVAKAEKGLSVDLTVITFEINSYKRAERNAVFEIGKRLKHVKENDLTHGQFTKWVESLGYSPRTAQRFMKVYERFGDMDAAFNLPVSSLFEMLSLPSEIDAATFLSGKHEIPSKGKLKAIGEMTKNEIRSVIKEIKEPVKPMHAPKATPATDISGEVFEFIYEEFRFLSEWVSELSTDEQGELYSCLNDISDIYRYYGFIKRGIKHEVALEAVSLNDEITRYFNFYETLPYFAVKQTPNRIVYAGIELVELMILFDKFLKIVSDNNELIKRTEETKQKLYEIKSVIRFTYIQDNEDEVDEELEEIDDDDLDDLEDCDEEDWDVLDQVEL